VASCVSLSLDSSRSIRNENRGGQAERGRGGKGSFIQAKGESTLYIPQKSRQTTLEHQVLNLA
jgi:hypothetical protein